MRRFLSILLSGCMVMPMLTAPAFAAAEVSTETLTPQMTYVDFSNADTAAGYIASGSTATSGYNNFNNGTIGMGNTGWGVNYITYLKVDASGITDNVISATLSMDVSGTTDNKRNGTYGAVNIAYTAWDNSLTYNTANTNGMLSGTQAGDTVTTSTKSYSEFETKTIDITDALKNDDDKVLTIAIYETEPAGGYVKNPSVKVKHSSSAGYTVTYSVYGIESTETVYEDEYPANIPDAAKACREGYVFKGLHLRTIGCNRHYRCHEIYGYI